jgi:predicted TIM-barrel fold metal-dependent hydrolase
MTASTPELIDFHTHIRPPWWEGATNPAAAGLSPGSEDRVARMLDIDRMVEESRAAGITHRALSAGVEGVYGPQADVPASEVRRVNEFTAESVAKAPGMFYGLATIDAYTGDTAAKEAEYAVSQLGMHGLFLDAQRHGVYPGAPQARPTFAAAAELGVPIFIHPVWAPDDAAFRTAGGSAGGSFGRGVTQGLAALSLLHSGIFEEFPDLDVLITAYGTGAIIFAVDAIAAYAKAHGVTPRLHVDTLTFHPPTIRYVIDALGPDRIVLGSDWPIRLDAYADTISAAFDEANLTPEERTMVSSGTARRMLRLS